MGIHWKAGSQICECSNKNNHLLTEDKDPSAVCQSPRFPTPSVHHRGESETFLRLYVVIIWGI